MSRHPAQRPILIPAIRRLWRDPHSLQLGTDPGRAVVLEFTDPSCARLLDLLDGTRTEVGYIRAAVRQGISAEYAATLVATLREAGFVVDARSVQPMDIPEATRERLRLEVAALTLPGGDRSGPDAAERIRRRFAAQVLVTGTSRLAVPIAATLASAGVGHLDPNVTGVTRLADVAPAGLLPSDAKRPRGLAAADAVRRAAPDVSITSLRPARATFAVLVGFTAPATLTALSYGSRRLAHLAVAVRDGTVVVGPLVLPGTTPCLNCLDLHRLDRDPGWRIVASQLHTGPEMLEPAAATTVLAGAAFAAAEVLAHIDGNEPTTIGATVEISGPGVTTRRRWTQHPLCGCRTRVRSRPTQATSGPT